MPILDSQYLGSIDAFEFSPISLIGNADSNLGNGGNGG